MVNLSSLLKDCGISCNNPTCTEWNSGIQAIEDAINTAVQSQIPPIFPLTDGATINVDWSKSPTQRVIIAGNRTFAFTGAKSGQRCHLILVQNGVGGFTSPTWPASMRGSGGSITAPTGTANKTTHYVMVYDDIAGKYDVLSVTTNL